MTADKLSFYLEYEHIINDLKDKMSYHRYEHSIGVMHTAACLSILYNENVEKAMLAGLLHDCTKHFSVQEHIELCKKKNVRLSEEDLKITGVLHSITAPIVAEQSYGIDDADILSAIRYHTTGCTNMSKLDKIIYIADFIEPGRRFKFDNMILEIARKKAFAGDLNLALIYILDEIVKWLGNSGSCIHKATISARDYYINAE